jgi:hypothetical protein
MAKDPAILWYWNDWHGGTVTFSRHLKGCFMDLLHAQFNTGHLSLEEIKNVLGNDFATWQTLSKKFTKDENGLFYNTRMEEENIKRRAFIQSRKDNRVNGLKKKAASSQNIPPDEEIENRSENEIHSISRRKPLTLEAKKALLDKRAQNFKQTIAGFSNLYPPVMLHRFYQYWTEPNKTFTRLRFELNRTWDLRRRLDYWAGNDKNFNTQNSQNGQVSNHRKGQPDIDDALATARQILANAAGNPHNS